MVVSFRRFFGSCTIMLPSPALYRNTYNILWIGCVYQLTKDGRFLSKIFRIMYNNVIKEQHCSGILTTYCGLAAYISLLRMVASSRRFLGSCTIMLPSPTLYRNTYNILWIGCVYQLAKDGSFLPMILRIMYNNVIKGLNYTGILTTYCGLAVYISLLRMVASSWRFLGSCTIMLPSPTLYRNTYNILWIGCVYQLAKDGSFLPMIFKIMYNNVIKGLNYTGILTTYCGLAVYISLLRMVASSWRFLGSRTIMLPSPTLYRNTYNILWIG